MSSNNVYDIVIVGAGISGLTAAYRLLQENESLKILVLEAKDRVGGRTVTKTLKSGTDNVDQWDLGGQWVGRPQVHIVQLLEELGLEVHKQFNKGTKLARLSDGKIRKYTTGLPFTSPFSYLDLYLFLRKVNKLCNEVNDPFRSPQERTLDSLTLENFKQSQCWTKDNKELLDSACGVIFGAHPSQISLLFYLHYCKCAGGAEPILESDEGSGQEWRIKGGAQNVCFRLLENIGKQNVVLQEPVDEINQEDNEMVQVTTKTGKKISTKYVIMAVPPHQAMKINYVPSLPFNKKHLICHMPVGHLIKFIITYASPFWRDQGLSGEVVSFDSFDVLDANQSDVNKNKSMGPKNNSEDEHFGKEAPVSVVYDATSSNDSGALVGFISGLAAARWTDKTERAQKLGIVKFLKNFFGDKAENYVDFAIKDWSKEPYNGGCPVNYSSPGALSVYQHCLSEPFQRVHWSGTETATVWCGFMNGAVEAGTRSANEILRKLSPKFVPSSNNPHENSKSSKRQFKENSNINYWTFIILSIVVLSIGVFVATVYRK